MMRACGWGRWKWWVFVLCSSGDWREDVKETSVPFLLVMPQRPPNASPFDSLTVPSGWSSHCGHVMTSDLARKAYLILKCSSNRRGQRRANTVPSFNYAHWSAHMSLAVMLSYMFCSLLHGGWRLCYELIARMCPTKFPAVSNELSRVTTENATEEEAGETGPHAWLVSSHVISCLVYLRFCYCEYPWHVLRSTNLSGS